MGKRNKNEELDHVLTRAEFKKRADHVAQTMLGLPSRKEAFRKLDRGELAGTVVEAELKQLRWMSEKDKASDKEKKMEDNDRSSLFIYSDRLEELWHRLASKSSEQEIKKCFVDSCSEHLDNSYDSLEDAITSGVSISSQTYFFSINLAGTEYVFLFKGMTEIEAYNKILRYWCERNDVFLKRGERINIKEHPHKKNSNKRKQASGNIKAPSPTMRISWRGSQRGKRP